MDYVISHLHLQIHTRPFSKPFYFFRVMKRVITLINQLASASATTAALQAQADKANQAAEKYMKDNELLKQVFTTRVGLFIYHKLVFPNFP